MSEITQKDIDRALKFLDEHMKLMDIAENAIGGEDTVEAVNQVIEHAERNKSEMERADKTLDRLMGGGEK
jgi:hypothetical protein